MKKLIVLEGPDGLGKTTHSKMLAEKFNANIIRQPSTDNCVSFIRELTKQDLGLSGFERQLLISLSHCVDAFTKFNNEENIVMDRSWLSGPVYGKLTGVDPSRLVLLETALSSIYQRAIEPKYQVSIFILTADNRFNNTDDSVFERQIKWKDLDTEYRRLHKRLTGGVHAFSSEEQVYLIDVTGKTKEQVQTTMLEQLDGTQ